MDVFLKETFVHMEKLEYVLLFNANVSNFKQTRKMGNDLEEKSQAINFSKLLGGGKGVYYTVRGKNKTYHQKEFESDLYLISIDNKIDWELSQEKKKIGKYVCYKATANDRFIGSSGNVLKKKIIAWYTPEIAFSYGPLKYNGLPGLILELENDKVIFYTKEIHLNMKENISIEKPEKGIEISQKRYDSVIKGLATDFRKKYKRN
jgi:GLPGLI family protein